mgnify:CR=1 FL=1
MLTQNKLARSFLARIKRKVKLHGHLQIPADSDIMRAVRGVRKDVILFGPGFCPPELGRVVVSHGVMHAVAEREVWDALLQHQFADRPKWCDVVDGRLSLPEGVELISAYASSQRVPFFVVTDREELKTAVVLPEEVAWRM